ncbi:MAG: YihY/virulence factor BrkB family protein, partial [Nocardioidaceae bacterium]|nr:YihY/virulence factor BrkB family protein [Nocardioidaceae bacterium]
MADEKPGLVDSLKAKVSDARERWPALDHTIGMVQYYGEIQGSVLAGAVTFFGFLSFFPILALAFAVIGYVSIAYPDARDALVTAIEQIFPGIVSPTAEPGKISLAEIESSRAAAGIIGFVGVLYSGLGWLSGLRAALQVAFGIGQEEKRNFFAGKAIDLVVLALIGAVLIVSVGISGVVQGVADRLIDWIGLEGTWVGTPLVWTVGIVLGVAASTLLFFVMFKLLPSPDLPSKPLWQGAFLGAVGFEALKLVVVFILGGVGGSAFAPLAIAITLVVWIN